MALISRIVAAVLLIAALGGAASAQTFSPTEGLKPAQYYALVNRVDGFDAAMRANDMVAVLGVVPPKVLDRIAASNGITIEQLMVATQQQLDQAMQSITLVSFEMDLKAAEFITLADGTPYALIPTETVMDLGEAGGKYRARSSTLGMLDGETWYLVRTEDPQQAALLKEVYPAFADVEFPAGSMEPVTE